MSSTVFLLYLGPHAILSKQEPLSATQRVIRFAPASDTPPPRRVVLKRSIPEAPLISSIHGTYEHGAGSRGPVRAAACTALDSFRWISWQRSVHS